MSGTLSFVFLKVREILTHSLTGERKEQVKQERRGTITPKCLGLRTSEESFSTHTRASQLSTTHILDQIILCCEVLSCALHYV